MVRFGSILMVCSALVLAGTANLCAQDSASNSDPVDAPTPSYLPQDPSTAKFLQVGFSDRLDTTLPMDLTFRNEEGKMVKLADYFNRGRPVVLMLVYYECPMLCNLLLNGFVTSATDVARTGDKFKIGGHYDVVTVSFNSEETHVLAAEKKANYIKQLGTPGADEGWHFLVGDQKNIDALTSAAGFTYEFDPKSGEYAHKAGILMVTEKGKISRYLAGIDFPTQDMAFALTEAGEGKIGSFTTKIFLSCYSYDPETGKYTPIVHSALLWGCLGTVLVMAIFLTRLIRFDVARQRAFAEGKSTPTEVRPGQ